MSGFGTRTGLRTAIDMSPGVSKIDDAAAVHLFRVCQEALTNVYRHAGAHSVKVKLEVDKNIRLTVKDDGRGGLSQEGYGLTGMRERVAAAGGTVTIDGSNGASIAVSLLDPRAATAPPSSS